MNELRKLENGCTTRFAVLDENGSEKIYKLAIISRPGWRGEESDRRYEFAYIHDDGFGNITKTSGTYSGGVTGSGVSSYETEMKLEDAERIETTDLPTIIKMAEDFENKKNAERDALNARKQEAVKKLNESPEVFFQITTSGGITYKISRSEFSHEPFRSSQLQGGYRTEREDRYFTPDDYFRKDGVMLKKKVAGDTVYLVGDHHLLEATSLVQTLREKKAEAKKQMNDIWSKAVYGK